MLNDFLLKDYELKISYLTNHFSRIWMRFNFFVTIESALVGGKFVFGNGKLGPGLAIAGAGLSLIWYVIGAEDRFMVRFYRYQVKGTLTEFMLQNERLWPRQEFISREESRLFLLPGNPGQVGDKI